MPIPVEAGLPHAPSADADEVQNLDHILRPIQEKHACPALAAAVTRSQGLAAIGAVGVRKLGATERVTINDLFHIGSCTKSMTALSIAMLVEEGRLSWSATIREIFPELAEQILPVYRNVTVEQLLCHRSGLPEDRDPDAEIYARFRALDGPIRGQRRELVKLIFTRDPAARPGSKHLYSNCGYAVIGAVAEAVTGKQYEDLLRERIFKPLDMDTAGFGAPGSPHTVEQPWGHSLESDSLRPIAPGSGTDVPPIIAPAGAVHCSLADFARYAAFHLRAAKGDGAGLLRPTSIGKLHSDPYGQEYGLGWAVVERNWAGGSALTHAGSNTYFYAVVWIAPEQDMAMMVATNRWGDEAVAASNDTLLALIEAFSSSNN